MNRSWSNCSSDNPWNQADTGLIIPGGWGEGGGQTMGHSYILYTGKLEKATWYFWKEISSSNFEYFQQVRMYVDKQGARPDQYSGFPERFQIGRDWTTTLRKDRSLGNSKHLCNLTFCTVLKTVLRWRRL